MTRFCGRISDSALCPRFSDLVFCLHFSNDLCLSRSAYSVLISFPSFFSKTPLMPIGGWSWTVYRYPGGISRDVGPSLDVSSLTPVLCLSSLSLLCVRYILYQSHNLLSSCPAVCSCSLCACTFPNQSCYRVVIY